MPEARVCKIMVNLKKRVLIVIIRVFMSCLGFIDFIYLLHLFVFILTLVCMF